MRKGGWIEWEVVVLFASLSAPYPEVLNGPSPLLLISSTFQTIAIQLRLLLEHAQFMLNLPKTPSSEAP